MPILLIYI